MRPTILVLAAALGALLGPSPAAAQLFRSPIGCVDCISGHNYVDLDPTPGSWVDYDCHTGHGAAVDGHRGVDYLLRGGNAAIDTGYDIVAVADGVVVAAIDGFYDHCRTCDGTVDDRCGPSIGAGFANHVVIDHGAFRVTYAHMRTDSVRVAVGDHVTCGQVLGQIGSSGCSTTAHLHFEVHPQAGGARIDPYFGACSEGTTSTFWTDQGVYDQEPGVTCEAPGPDADGDGAQDARDCDDADPTIHPGATDVCGDGVDQDCDGADRACRDAETSPDAGTGGADDAAVGVDAGVALDGGSRPDAGVALDGGSGPDARASDDASARADAPVAAPASACACSIAAHGSPRGSAIGLLVAMVALASGRRSRARARGGSE